MRAFTPFQWAGAVVLIVLLLVGGYAYCSLSGLDELAEQTRSTRLIQLQLLELLGLARDAETGQRGYLLTGRPEYLQPYNVARQKLPAVRQRLTDLLQHHEAAQTHLRRLDEHLDAKLVELADTIALAQAHQRDQALARVNSGEGKQTMDQLRAALKALDELAQDRITDIWQRRSDSSRFTQIVLWFGLVWALLAVMVLLIYARRPRATLPVPLAVQKLTRLYMSALLLLGLLLLSGQLVIQAALSDLQQDARVLNLAGRQRMLSQELLKCVLVLNHAPAGIARQPYATELRDVLLTWRQTHRGLREGDTDLGLPSNLSTTGLEQYKQLHAAFMKLFTTAHALLAAHDADDPAALPPLVLTALRADTEFRTGMDGLVRTLENEARERVMWVRGWNCLFSWPRCWY